MGGVQGGMVMTDAAVRAALKEELYRRHAGDSETLIVEELGLRHGAARIDLAVINGRLLGIEIKSNSDSLQRLPKQAGIYNSVLDRVALVCGSRHMARALQLVPDWWGITLAESRSGGTIRLTPIRKPRDNPSLDPVAIARLLWREEALSALAGEGGDDGLRSKRRALIYAKLAEVISLDSLRARVRQQLRARSNWRSAG